MPRNPETTQMAQAARRYRNEFFAAMAVYMVTVLLAGRWLRTHPDSTGRVAVALAPLLPIIFALWALVRFYLRLDELHRRMQVESLAFAFTGTALLVITYGFLETAGFPKLTMWWVWTVMAVLWLVGRLIGVRRYR